jgi:hypothetical protein
MHSRGPVLLVALPLLASLALPLSGCYSDVESFAKVAAKHGCKRLRECDKARFDDEYDGDLGRCKDDAYTDYLDLNDMLETLGCDYSPDGAQDCDKMIRSLKTDCSDDADQDIVDACEDAYDCPLGLQLDPNGPGPAAAAGQILASWPDDTSPPQ